MHGDESHCGDETFMHDNEVRHAGQGWHAPRAERRCVRKEVAPVPSGLDLPAEAHRKAPARATAGNLRTKTYLH